MIARSLGKALRPLSAAFRAKVRALYLAERPPRFDRARLEQCLFVVQNELEHRSHDHPQVAIMNAVRNVLLDDLGVNEDEQMNRLRARVGRPLLRWPHVERVAGIISEKRRAAPGHGFGSHAPTSRIGTP